MDTADVSSVVIWSAAAAVLGLILLSAFFSGSETALTAASRAKLKKLSEDGSSGAKAALKLTEDNERLIGAILLGNNLVNILATSLATSVLLAIFGESGVVIATFVMTLLVLVFAEVLPKTYAISRPEKAAERVGRAIAVVVQLFSPIVALVRLIVRGALGVLGVKIDPDAQILSVEELQAAIDLHHSEGGVARDARDRLLGALDLDEREVAQVMVHRRNIFVLDAASPAEELLDAALSSSYTRIPLFRDEPENIVGVVHAKDLLREVNRLMRGDGGTTSGQGPEGLERLQDLDVAEIAMQPWFVPDTTSLAEQLRAFLARRSHFALVVDEYGALQGLVTLEDIIEEIVGDIADEHDEEVAGVTRDGDGFIVDGDTTIRELNRLFDWRLPDEEATTIAGLVIHEAQTIPTKGQIFLFHGFRFEILERKRHQITKIRLRRELTPAETDG